ncbi:hypothetical protein ACQPXH_27350 [Nocardia sp. CA-135953]
MAAPGADRLNEDSRKAVSVAVGAIAERRRRPDAGIDFGAHGVR